MWKFPGEEYSDSHQIRPLQSRSLAEAQVQIGCVCLVTTIAPPIRSEGFFGYMRFEKKQRD